MSVPKFQENPGFFASSLSQGILGWILTHAFFNNYLNHSMFAKVMHGEKTDRTIMLVTPLKFAYAIGSVPPYPKVIVIFAQKGIFADEEWNTY